MKESPEKKPDPPKELPPEEPSVIHEGNLCERIAKCPLELEFMEPMPEKIDFFSIPKINEARKVWRAGMRKLEEVFAEHIANMHLDYEEKTKQYHSV